PQPILYAALTQIARLAAALAPAREGKTWRALRARRGIRDRYIAWGQTARDPDRPLLWMHAPSVGEGLQARPVLEILRGRHPGWQFAYTYFSPSAERFARSLGADFTDYLPFDTTGDMRIALDALRPRAIVFSKLDVWPTLAREADARGVRLALISATLAAGSSRRGRIASALLRDAYSRLDAVGAIDADDAARLTTLGTRHKVITVSGDTRYDQVWARAQAVRPDDPPLAPLRGPRPTLVAGSTWPADEAVLLPAWEQVRRSFPDARVIIAPHEPHAARLSAIESWAVRASGRCFRQRDRYGARGSRRCARRTLRAGRCGLCGRRLPRRRPALGARARSVRRARTHRATPRGQSRRGASPSIRRRQSRVRHDGCGRGARRLVRAGHCAA